MTPQQAPKATYAAKLKQATGLEQELLLQDLVKKSASATLHPLSNKPSLKALFFDMKRVHGKTFSIVPTQQGNYVFTPANSLDTQILKISCTPVILIGGCEFKTSTFEDNNEDYVLTAVPEFVPRGLINETFGRDATISNLKPIRKKMTDNEGNT